MEDKYVTFDAEEKPTVEEQVTESEAAEEKNAVEEQVTESEAQVIAEEQPAPKYKTVVIKAGSRKVNAQTEQPAEAEGSVNFTLVDAEADAPAAEEAAAGAETSLATVTYGLPDEHARPAYEAVTPEDIYGTRAKRAGYDSQGRSDSSPAGMGTQDRSSNFVTKRAFAGALAAAVVISSLAGAGLSTLFNRSTNSEPPQSAAVEAADSGDTAANVVPLSAETLSIEQIVSKNADAVVEINTEVIQMSYWGQETAQGAGSGVIVKENGYIATNYHVIEGAESISVTLHNGEEYPAQIVGTDEQNDIAVLKIAAEGLTAVDFGKSSDLRVGDLTVAIGNPLGQLGGTATQGIVSALDRKIEIEGKQLTLLQTDSAINPGNSGGGLFNSKGELIGIVVAKSSATGVEGLGFAIPIDTAAPIIEDLISNGHVTERPAAGITIYNVPEDRVDYYGVDAPGVYVGDVYGENVSRAGLMSGDRLIALDGQKIESSSGLIADIQKHKIGDEVTLTVSRGGEEIDITFNLEDSSKFNNN